mmetsp:Transcript_18370/g.54387  ORF Transcript_18370/g.54387 Transcript_18370/m.54387 type:complete len:204 (+) Transcript_18370:280-891(+)
MRALWAARWRRTTHIAAGGATWGWQKGPNRSGRGRCRASQPSQAPRGRPSPAASPRARAPRPTSGHQAARRAAQTPRSGMQTAPKQVSVHSSSRRGAPPRSRRRVPLAGRGRTRPRMPARASARARPRHAATARTRSRGRGCTAAARLPLADTHAQIPTDRRARSSSAARRRRAGSGACRPTPAQRRAGPSATARLSTLTRCC